MDVGVTSPPHTTDPVPQDAGFTLIELAVVVTILAILSVGIGASMSFARLTPQADDDLILFEERLAQLQAQAVYKQTPQGLRITNTGWQIQRFDPTAHTWDKGGRVTRWKNAVFFQKSPLAKRGGNRRQSPDIVLLPDGRSTPFEITFTHNSTSIQCRNDGWTGLRCDP